MSTFKGFTSVQLQKPTRSKFDLSHEKRISTRMGRLTPIFVTETIPNDTFRCNTEIMLRLAPLLAPIMHRVNVFVHYFFVPNRLLWKDWEAFITGGRLGTETPPIPPRAAIDTMGGEAANLMDVNSLFDYLGGAPITDAGSVAYGATMLDMMPFCAYYKIWADYYRDRNYVPDDPTTNVPMPSGTQVTANAKAFMSLKTRDWQKDYFTSALPWTQRGNEVLMPLVGSGTAAVTYLGQSLVKRTSDGALNPSGDTQLGQKVAEGAGLLKVGKTSVSDAGVAGRIENIDTVSVNVNSSGVSINDLRTSIKLQQWLERNALAGSRYSESIYAHFARRSSDGRLQRAEYLGGGRVTVKIQEVVTTAWSQDGSANDVPPGNMAGHGHVLDGINSFTYNCEEHGFIFGIMSVMPNSAYMQGIPRMFVQRNTFLDYPWPSFAHLGEQKVYKYELYADATNLTVDRTAAPVFGYQSRYSDWKYIPSSCHGDFRSTLDFWHLTRKFASSPSLGATFCTFEDALQNRVFAVADVDNIWAYVYNNCSVIRALPYYGTPKL